MDGMLVATSRILGAKAANCVGGASLGMMLPWDGQNWQNGQFALGSMIIYDHYITMMNVPGRSKQCRIARRMQRHTVELPTSQP